VSFTEVIFYIHFGETLLRLQAQVNEQGMLVIQMPPSFRGKQVVVSIDSVPSTENAEAILVW
jgi:hypothetical protein